MRIDLHFEPQQAQQSDRSSPQTSQAASAAANQAQVGQDQTILSGAHVQVEALAAQAAQLPEIRQGKIEALRQAVQSGQYQSDPHKTADALLTQMALAVAS